MIASSNEQIKTTSRSIAQNKKTDHILLTNKFVTHHPKSGLNPLVDAAAYIFSIIGRLKIIKTYRHLNKLQKELIVEINHFQETAKSRGYNSEYILASRFALCATLDDIISNTPWGGQGQWETHTMLAVFNQDNMNHDRFFIILERIIKDPGKYIDVMEFMYICLSLGFKGNYRSTEFGSNQLEHITHVLYRRIRKQHGDFTKALSPYIIKATKQLPKKNNATFWIIPTVTFSIILVLFLSLSYMVDSISKQAYQELIHIGNSLTYETPHS